MDDLERLEETIAVLSDHDLMTQLAAAETDLAAGRIETQDELDAAMRRRRAQGVTDQPHTLRIVSAARRHLSVDLPSAVAFAASGFIKGPLLVNPYRGSSRSITR